MDEAVVVLAGRVSGGSRLRLEVSLEGPGDKEWERTGEAAGADGVNSFVGSEGKGTM